MNRQNRRAKSKSSVNALQYVKAGHAAYKQGQYAAAIENYMQAAELDRNNHNYKLYLCDVLKTASFSQFNPKIKLVIQRCLNARGLDCQNLWKPWFSTLMCDPDMAGFHSVMNGEAPDAKNLKQSVSSPFFIAGLNKLICFDTGFEKALQAIKMDIDAGGLYPKAFRQALATYCHHTEYVFCPPPEDEAGYKVDNTIETISVSDNTISKEVRAQYESNPYPRWVSCNVPDLDGRSAKKPYDHLVAGCGTGYGLCMTAARHPEANITAVDLSLASISYAKSKARELGFNNIKFYHADILDLSPLDQTFDVIECSGVLHHMEAPETGWRSLIDKLRPEGKMHIGLYSELGREDVVAAQDFIKAGGYASTHEGIQEGRHAIINLPTDHPARGILQRRDFYSISSCRDLIFHVQEHRYTIEKLKTSLQELGLEFDGFSIESAALMQKYHRDFPDDPHALNLDNWAGFEKQNP